MNIFPGSNLQALAQAQTCCIALQQTMPVRCLCNGHVCATVMGDIGPDDHSIGEMSIVLAQALADHPVTPRNGSGQVPVPYQIAVFPRSRFTPFERFSWHAQTDR